VDGRNEGAAGLDDDPGVAPTAGDGWVLGAWTMEGLESATAPRRPGPVEDEAGSVEDETDRRPEPGPDGADSTDSTDSTDVTDRAPGGDPVRGPSVADPAPPVAPFPEAGSTPSALPSPFARTAPESERPEVPPEPAPAPVSEPIVPALPEPSPAPARTRPRADASAAELTEDAIVRHRSDRPSHGWRGALYRGTGGLVNPGIGPVEKARQEQLRRIRRPLPGSHQIAVSSIKGGVGKTTVSACLGLVLAESRGDRVIALDANPDAGTLADRLTGETSVTVRHLLDNLASTHSLTDVARYTSLAGRLQVLASEQDPAMSEAFNRDEYERVCEVLTRFYNIVITDSGTGLVHSAMEGTLALADSLVVVGAPTVDGSSRASKTLDWLIAHGYAAQVADAVVVLSCDRTSKEVDRARIREHFEARCRAVVEIPHDPHLATGGRIDMGRIRPETHDALLALAARLADGFGTGAAEPAAV
jgi:MinD-like ATPase involved in chromosome partitioning or flagellar assembly